MTPTDKQRAKFEAAATHDMLWAAISEMNRLGRSISCDEMRAVLTAALAAQDGGGGERVTDDPVIPDMPAYLAEGGDVMVGWDSGYMSGWCDCLKALRAAQEGTGNG
ncbi:hypothetical protein RGI145_22375 [Roseomonas gilardii]|uniref:Uncharacterized protein n=1 Tax=Roseomonas gilardii TaxID=257708 RepID=A0A1L7AMV0_9PROT|nr:hypothetical protein [Roseomonas gilardii]APT60034.1 hypothetical protein RGI145_22375 [Roseomonas gilardii]